MSRALRFLPAVLLGAVLSSGCPDFPESGKWACDVSADCNPGETCLAEGFCGAATAGRSCVINSDCLPGRTCTEQGVCCVPLGGPCNGSGDCCGEQCVDPLGIGMPVCSPR